MPQHVLTQLLWDTTSEETPFWHRSDAVRWQDWRSLPDQGTPGPTPQGWILAQFPTGVVPPNSVDLGDSLDGLLLPGARASMRSVLRLGEALPGATLRQAIQNLLIRMGDPTSQTRWRGIRASGNRLQLRIGGVIVLDESFSELHPAWNHTRDIFRAAYRYLRDQVNAGTLPLEAAQRYTGHEMRKYGVAAEALLPPEYVRDGHRPPRTTITDTFTEGSDTVLSSHNTDFAWVLFDGDDILTVRATPDKAGNNGITSGMYRADSNLSTDEHRSQILITYAGDNSDDAHAIFRKAANSTVTHYDVEWRASTDRQIIEQFVTGTKTILATKITTAFGGAAFTGKGDIDGSDILRQYINGTEEQSFDDSASPVGAANLQCGIGCDPRGDASEDDILIDDFEAADVVAVAAAKRRRVGFGAGMAMRM